MAPDAVVPANEEPRRKTLDEIRREINAEFAVEDEEAAEVEAEMEALAAAPRRTLLRMQADAPARGTSWRGYVTAGAVGCIVGQLLIVAYVAVGRYGGDIMDVWTRASRVRLSAPVLRGDDAAAALPSLSAPAAPRAAPAAGAPGAQAALREPAAPQTAAPEAAVPEPAAKSEVIAALPPAPPVPVPAEAAPPGERASVDPPRSVSQPPPGALPQRPPGVPVPPVAAAPRRPMVGPADWVESQAQLRAALGEWLAIWSRGDADTRGSDAEVILSADGWTAKTRVPTTSRAGVIIREQRWERGPNGWRIVDDREVERVRR
jgi:hypothetical protein